MSNTEKIDELDSRISNLEYTVKELERQINRLLNAHGENVPHPADVPSLKCQCHEK